MEIRFINYPTEQHKEYIKAVSKEEDRIKKRYHLIHKVFLAVSIVVLISMTIITAIFIVKGTKLWEAAICLAVLFTIFLCVIKIDTSFNAKEITSIFSAIKNLQSTSADITQGYCHIKKNIAIGEEIKQLLNMPRRFEAHYEQYLVIHNKERYAESANVEMGFYYTDNDIRKSVNIIIPEVSLEWSTKELLPIYDIMNRKLIIPKEITLEENIA